MASASADPRQFFTNEMHCPICLNFMYPPIHQCPNGHLLCSNCRISVGSFCPSCRRELGDIRCLIVEKMAEIFEFPCKYHDQGCKELLRYKPKEKHEEECEHRPYNCPFPCSPPCVVESDNTQMLISHMRLAHQVHDAIDGGKIIGHFDVRKKFLPKLQIPRVYKEGEAVSYSSSVLQVYRCFEEHFCLQVVSSPPPKSQVLLIYLMFIGEPSGARRFLYRLQVGEMGSKAIYEGVPISIREERSVIHDNLRGLIVHSCAVAHLALPEKKVIRLRGEILKADARDEYLWSYPPSSSSCEKHEI